MSVLRIAAFSDGDIGGNPAGVLIADELPNESEMQRIAAEVGFSETAFAAPAGTGWRVRYFSPESEVPFCGHATLNGQTRHQGLAILSGLTKQYVVRNYPRRADSQRFHD